MCGRFTQQQTWAELMDHYDMQGPGAPLNLEPRYNGAPTQEFATCRIDGEGGRTIAKLRWGLRPPWAGDRGKGTLLINARAETVHSKPSFRAAFGSRRCLIPANGWFEWQRSGDGRQPYFLAAADGSPLSFAGVWERGDEGSDLPESFAIVTTTAHADLEDIHPRQPAIVSPDRFGQWLDPATPLQPLLDLVREPHAGPYERRAVSPRVNNVRNDDPDVLAPGIGTET